MRQQTYFPRTPRGKRIHPNENSNLNLGWSWVCEAKNGYRYDLATCFERPHIFFGDDMSCPHPNECGWERKDNAKNRIP